MTIRAAAVILAAGSGSRVGAPTNKALLPLDGVPLLVHSLRTVLRVDSVQRVVLVIRPDERDAVAEAAAPHLGEHDLWLVDGGQQRHDSEWQALSALADDIDGGELDVVAIHDAARPLATEHLWDSVIAAAIESGGALPVLPGPRLSHRDGSLAVKGLVGVQTPQAFRAKDLLGAYRQALRDGFTGTDTAACLERYTDLALVGVPGTPNNLKVTFPEDLAVAEFLLTGTRQRRDG